ncbi:DNA-binding beta-propeller fold protein YncE [Nitrosospira sp. Nsp2]|nr:DNA-binding beta-propeller fold protein YncE [Nitrosospira sp. Nsp2]
MSPNNKTPQQDIRGQRMNKFTLRMKLLTAMALGLIAAIPLGSTMALAASHNIVLSAEILPNGQPGYKMVSHSGNQGSHYPSTAVIPGPTLFVKQGDSVSVQLVNNTKEKVGFKVPGLSHGGTVAPGQTGNYSVDTSARGTHLYHDEKLGLTGLFGAIVVDRPDGKVESYLDADGRIVPVKRQDVKKQQVLFMVGSTFWGTEISQDGTQTPLWTNPTLGAVHNDIVRFHILSVGPGHTFHLHAHRWLKPVTETRKGKDSASRHDKDRDDYSHFRRDGDGDRHGDDDDDHRHHDLSKGTVEHSGTPGIIDTKLLADRFDSHVFTVKAGSGVGPGNWQYHCHLFSHMEAGMHGSFRVDPVGSPQMGTSIAGASPHGAIFGHTSNDPGLVTFIISDQPSSWFRSARADTIFGITGGTRSLEVLPPGGSVNFIMSDTNTVHSITSLIWPSGAPHLPFDQARAYKGGGLLHLSKPGLYVFTCKVHPYMFGAVIVDDPATDGLDLGETIDLAPGIKNLPTSSDLATFLLRTFFVATAPNNWQDYTSGKPWNITYPNVSVRITGGASVNLSEVLIARYGNNTVLTPPVPPRIHGVGEVWVDTQFEKTAGKSKPGTISVVDTTTWKVTRKIALPEINMNNPHNMWTNRDQSIVFQTQWFDNKLTMIDKRTGKLIKNIRVGEAPAHVMTRPDNDDITVTNNGEDGVSIIPAGTTKVKEIMPTQKSGQLATNPHGHWISADGNQVVTPNIFTNDVGFYDIDSGVILERTSTGGSAPGAHPIAIGMMPDSSKAYAANLLHHSVSVLDRNGSLLKTINLIADYNPIDGTIQDRDGDGLATVGILPIQLPVSPDGRAVVVANMGQSIIVIDTRTDRVVKMLPCDPGCHGANFGAKKGGGYYAYVTSKFSNELIVVDVDPNNDGNVSDAEVAGRVSLVSNSSTHTDDRISGLAGYGGQGVLAIPNVYNSWVKNLPDEWKSQLTPAQRNPSHH